MWNAALKKKKSCSKVGSEVNERSPTQKSPKEKMDSLTSKCTTDVRLWPRIPMWRRPFLGGRGVKGKGMV
jgi:hypothetical protein